MMGDPELTDADADRLRALASQFPEILAHVSRLLDPPPPEPEPDLGFPLYLRCGCGWRSEEPVQYHRRGSATCEAARERAS